MQSVGKIISTYRKKNGYSQPELAEILNQKGFSLTNKAISKWEKDGSEPSITLFMALCQILGITDVYEEYFGINPDDPLSRLNAEGKEKVYEYIDLLISSGKYKKEQNTLRFHRTIRLFDIPASAGVGSFLDGDDFQEIEVGPEVPETADFGIHISGDSMEPRYVNGQIVWVHQQKSLLSGEIGIFYLDGNAFCKKLQEDENGLSLISLNKKYAPIAVQEENLFQVFGKVIS